MNNRRRRMSWVAVPVIAALLVAACGDSGDDDDATATPTTATSSATSTGTATGTVTPTGTTTASPTTTPDDGTADPAAVQTVLDYYAAINRDDFHAAYLAWADEGAASGQDFEAFAAGFDSTVRAVPQVDTASSNDEIQVTIRSVVTVSPSEQALKAFMGTYSVVESGNAWHIETADIQEVDPPGELPEALAEPDALLNAYIGAISDGDYGRAFTFWDEGGDASGQTFTGFVDGFDSTAAVELTMGDPRIGAGAGSSYAAVPAVVVSTLDDGTHEVFCGSYVLRKSNLRPFDQLGWHIYGATMSAVTGASPDDASTLLANNCRS